MIFYYLRDWLKRFNESVVDPKCLLKIWATSFCFGKKFFLFKQHIFLYITIFIWEVRFTCFPKWFGITINTKFLKVLQFGLFIQIWHQVSLSLKLDNVTGIFWLIWIVFETWFNNYLLPKVLIKMGFLILS